MVFFSNVKRAAAFCKSMYKKKLLLSDTLSTMALLAAGDMITQCIEKSVAPTSEGAQTKPATLCLMSSSTTSLALTDHSSPLRPSSLSYKESFYPVKQICDQGSSFLAYFDWNRTAKLTAVGLLMGPFGHWWYTFLDSKLPKKNLLTVLSKVVCDQLVAAPTFIGIVLVGINFLEGKQFREIYEQFKEKFMTIYSYDCLIWPVAQLINFNFIPAVYRLLYVNAISLFWNSFLSFLMFEELEA